MTTRPPEPLKDRLATIVQRGHVEKLTADEVAEMCLLECYTDSRNNPEDWFPFEVLREYVASETPAKDARIAELLRIMEDVRRLCPADPDINPEWQRAWDALVAAIAATKDAK